MTELAEILGVGHRVRDELGVVAENLKDALATYTDRDKQDRAIGEDVRSAAIPELMVEHAVVSDLLHEGLLIVGWVAMWRPLEILLYDWWPLMRDAQLYERIASMPVELRERR